MKGWQLSTLRGTLSFDAIRTFKSSYCERHTPPHDKGIPTTPSSSPPRIELPTGPITRARAKKLQDKVNLLLNEHVINFNENFVLPKNNILLVLRFEDSTIDGDQRYAAVMQGRPSNEEAQASSYGPLDQGEGGQGPCGTTRDQGPCGQA